RGYTSSGGYGPAGTRPPGGTGPAGGYGSADGRHRPGGYPPADVPRPSVDGGPGGPAAWATSAADSAVGKGPIRGFPPAPGQPPPFYPPGQFAAWNPPGARPAPREMDRSWYGGSNPDGQAYDPGYSALAVSDPAADVTSTQTWEKIPGL